MATKTTSVVLSLGSQRISLASIVGASKGSLALTKYHFRDLPGDPSSDSTRIPQIRLAVQELTSEAKVKGSSVRYSIAGQTVFMRFVKLPPISEEKVAQIVEFEAAQNVPFPIDEVSWGYQLVADPTGSEVEVLLGAMKSDELTALNSAVEGSGLTTLSADISPILIYNAYRYNYADQSDPVLLIDIGAKTTNLIYIEGEKVFISSSRIGGVSITSAIAKEFDISFDEAEALKLQSGFVGLGGAYAEHEDPQTAAMANVIRTTLTRLHGEIVRTNSRYRSQQGGQVPKTVYLAGHSAGLPYLSEFFAEKLGVDVQYFNALRNVAVGPNVNQELVASEAHAMGDLVGSALRNMDGNPIELELVPESLARTRDLENRKPALVMATVGLLSILGAAAFYPVRATQITETKTQEIQNEVTTLTGVSDDIRSATREWEAAKTLTDPYVFRINQRTWWADFLNDLNSRSDIKEVWFTGLEPVVDGEPITNPIADETGGLGALAKLASMTPKAPARSTSGPVRPAAVSGEMKIDSVRIRGLYRYPAKAPIVDNVIAALRESPYFNIKDNPEIEMSDLIPQRDNGLNDTFWAWDFTLTLPLKEEYQITVKEVDTSIRK